MLLQFPHEFDSERSAGAEGERVVGTEVYGAAIFPGIRFDGVQTVVAAPDVEGFFEVAVECGCGFHAWGARFLGVHPLG